MQVLVFEALPHCAAGLGDMAPQPRPKQGVEALGLGQLGQAALQVIAGRGSVPAQVLAKQVIKIISWHSNKE